MSIFTRGLTKQDLSDALKPIRDRLDTLDGQFRTIDGQFRDFRAHVDKRFDNIERMLQALGAPAERENVEHVKQRVRSARMPTAERERGRADA